MRSRSARARRKRFCGEPASRFYEPTRSSISRDNYGSCGRRRTGSAGSRSVASTWCSARFLVLLDNVSNPFKRPVDFFRCDGERGSDANHPVMGLFAQYAETLERFAIRPGWAMQLDPDPQALAADFFHVGL